MKMIKPIEATVYRAHAVSSDFDPDTKVVLKEAHDAVVSNLTMRAMRLQMGLLLIKDPYSAPKQFQEIYIGSRLIDVIDDFLNDRDPVLQAFESWSLEGKR